MTTTIKNCIITILFCCISSLLLGQNLEYDYGIKSYSFDKNSIDPSSMSYLDTIMVDYNHFFMSEYHGFNMDKNLKKKFVKYLAEKKQLNKIVMEEPYSYGYWVNKYLHTGDTVLLKTFLDNYYAFGRHGKNRPEQLPDYYDFFKFVYELNKKHGLNIEAVGVDLKTSVLKPEFWTLKKVFEEYGLENVYPESYKNLQKLNKRKKVRKGKAERWLNDLKNEVVAEDLAFTDVLKGEELTHFNYLINNLHLMLPRLAIINKPSRGYRDSLMYHRYVELVQPNDVAFSQFGGGHTLLAMGPKVQGFSQDYKFKSFTSLIEKDKNYSGKCLAIHLLYGEKDFPFGSYFFSNEEYNELRSITKYQEVLIDFRNAKEPYANISEYYQLAIFLNGRIN